MFFMMDKEAITMEVQKLAWEIRQRRGALGLTQQDVGVGLGAVYGTIFSQTTICRFEAGELSLDNMVKLMPKIETVLELHEKKGDIGENALNPPTVRKKTRTVFPPETVRLLEEEYRRCKLPNKEDLDRIAGIVGLEKKVVKNWFCNRKHKERTMNKTAAALPHNVPASSHSVDIAAAQALPYWPIPMDPSIMVASQEQNISVAPAHSSAWTGVMDLGLQGSSVQGDPPYWNDPCAWTDMANSSPMLYMPDSHW